MDEQQPSSSPGGGGGGGGEAKQKEVEQPDGDHHHHHPQANAKAGGCGSFFGKHRMAAAISNLHSQINIIQVVFHHHIYIYMYTFQMGTSHVFCSSNTKPQN